MHERYPPGTEDSIGNTVRGSATVTSSEIPAAPLQVLSAGESVSNHASANVQRAQVTTSESEHRTAVRAWIQQLSAGRQTEGQRDGGRTRPLRLG
jgi:hypothetical protein